MEGIKKFFKNREDCIGWVMCEEWTMKKDLQKHSTWILKVQKRQTKEEMELVEKDMVERELNRIDAQDCLLVDMVAKSG